MTGELGFKWLEGDCQGAIELFEATDLNTETQGKLISTRFKRGNSRTWERSMSILQVQKNIALLNSEPFTEQNTKLELYPGVLKLRLDGNIKNLHITEVEFKNIGEHNFIPVMFKNVTSKSAKRQLSIINSSLEMSVSYAMSLSNEKRQSLLPKLGNIPRKYYVSSMAFDRDPFVIAETFIRANGICEKCKTPAPFESKATGKPYLEVHHKMRLADGGTDDTENTIAICPNCHREFHFGR